MKKLITILAFGIGVFAVTNAQVSTAQDFTMSDCNSNTQNLYSHLDNEEVVIMEFFMTCGSCITAGQRITAMLPGLNSQYPGMVNFWALAYTNSYSCATVSNWVTTNSIAAVPFDSGAAQVAYYGGFAMPTVVVVAGSSHQVIYNSNYDGGPSDTAAIHTAINNFFNSVGIENNENNIQFNVFPNPATSNFNIELNLINSQQVLIQMVDLTGKVVREISNAELSEGSHSFFVATDDISNGVYFIRMGSTGKLNQYKISVNH